MKIERQRYPTVSALNGRGDEVHKLLVMGSSQDFHIADAHQCPQTLTQLTYKRTV
jgi:hypothetical protein